jgi:hypothetical protein
MKLNLQNATFQKLATVGGYVLVVIGFGELIWYFA